jgi:hypothetical protein
LKCHYHPGVDAVDKCTMCGKAMCSECKLDYDGKIVCKPCAMPLVNFFAPMIGGACSHTASTPPPGNLMKNLEKTLKGRVAEARLSPNEDEIRIYILRWMARNGKPPTHADIMNGLKIRSSDEVKLAIERLHNADIISARNGDISSAYPFSANETCHKVVFNDGHAVYALCAVDALGINSMLGEDIVIRSGCPNCERVQSIVVKDGRIVSHDPAETIVFISDEDDCGRVADTCCPLINFFCSEPHLQQWKWENPRFARGETYTLEEALEYGKQIFGGMLV